MKITLDKDTITLAKKDEALQFAADNTWVDKDTLRGCAEKLLQRYYGVDFVMVEEIVGTPKLEVTYSIYKGFEIYAKDMVVRFWFKGPGDDSGRKLANLIFGVEDLISDNVHGYVQIYNEVFHGVL